MLSRKAAATAGIMMLLMASVLIATEYSVNGPDSFSGAATRRSLTTAPTAIRTSNGVSTTPATEAIPPPPPALRVHLELPPQCRDKILNGEETDVDCGGTQCLPCDFGLVCALDRDCKSHNCLNGRCGPEPCELGASRCELDSAGNPSGYLQVCKESRQGFQRGELCANGCLNGKCIASCSDSDGNNINTAGISSGVFLKDLSSAPSEQRDFCTGSFVQEFTCQADSLGRNGLVQTGIECPNGCVDGACKPCDPNIGQPCNRNQCGGTGVFTCDGQCTADEPQLKFSLGTVGDSCNRNQCGGTGVVGCTGTCSASAPQLNFPIGTVGSDCNRNQCGGTGVVQCGGTCSATAPQINFPIGSVGGNCNRNQCGGSGTVTCSGTCSASTPQTSFSIGSVGGNCNRNQCGGTGTVTCSGTCSASAPYQPSNLGASCGCGGTIQCNGQCSASACGSGQVCQSGRCVAACMSNAGQACNRNQCGGTGTVTCSGTCSASAPSLSLSIGTVGSACNRNRCGGTGTVTCSGTCSASAPYQPSNLGASCGCGGTIQCNGQCSASNCAAGQTCKSGRCVIPAPAPVIDPCPGPQGCCCQYGYPDCASGYECRGWRVPGHQYFGTCTRRGMMYASELSGYEQPYCGK